MFISEISIELYRIGPQWWAGSGESSTQMEVVQYDAIRWLEVAIFWARPDLCA